MLPFLKPEGADYEEFTKPEEGGLRITLPGTRPVHYPVGVELTFPLSGDFEMTGSYELLSAARPANGYGVGVCLSVTTDPARRKFCKTARLWHPDKGSIYATEFWNHDYPLRDPRRWRFKPEETEARSGQLRLVREGETVRCLVADGTAKDFREIGQWPMGTDDLALVRFDVIDSGSPGNQVDARLVDLRIRTGQPIPEAAAEATPPPQPNRPARSRTWMVATLLLGLLLMGALLAALYLRSRQQAAEALDEGVLADQPTRSEVTPRSLSFSCPGCGKNLKARADLNGKKVKCPRCGQAVRVADTRTDASAPPSL